MVSPEIEAAAAWLRAQAEAVKSCSAVDVPPAETAFAALRLCACADGLLAGLHLPDPAEASA